MKIKKKGGRKVLTVKAASKRWRAALSRLDLAERRWLKTPEGVALDRARREFWRAMRAIREVRALRFRSETDGVDKASAALIRAERSAGRAGDHTAPSPARRKRRSGRVA
jgi:hypothetical protein